METSSKSVSVHPSWSFVTHVLEQNLPKSLDISEEDKRLDVRIEDEPSSRIMKARKIENLGIKEDSRFREIGVLIHV
uniref:Uncharacterized protein n=1 Tax=Noccaea caerulescens TaxID=107243 RepID=A0A1J3GSJ3_NOCCA